MTTAPLVLAEEVGIGWLGIQDHQLVHTNLRSPSCSMKMGARVIDAGPIRAGQAVSGNRIPVVEWQRYPKGFFARYCWWWSSA
jgi:hypothetical protein